MYTYIVRALQSMRVSLDLWYVQRGVGGSREQLGGSAGQTPLLAESIWSEVASPDQLRL